MFLKQEYTRLAKENPEKNLKEINVMLAEKWRSISKEDKLKYKELGKTEFQQKTDKRSKAQEEARVAEQSRLQTFAFLRMR